MKMHNLPHSLQQNGNHFSYLCKLEICITDYYGLAKNVWLSGKNRNVFWHFTRTIRATGTTQNIFQMPDPQFTSCPPSAFPESRETQLMRLFSRSLAPDLHAAKATAGHTGL